MGRIDGVHRFEIRRIDQVDGCPDDRVQRTTGFSQDPVKVFDRKFDLVLEALRHGRSARLASSLARGEYEMAIDHRRTERARTHARKHYCLERGAGRLRAHVHRLLYSPGPFRPSSSMVVRPWRS